MSEEELSRMLEEYAGRRGDKLRFFVNEIHKRERNYFNNAYIDVKKTLSDIEKNLDFRFNDLSEMLLRTKLGRWGRIALETEHRTASDSNDHKFPRGTIQDTTRSPAFFKALERYFGADQLRFLDLGCSGGGLIFDALVRGHLGVGVEGSDVSLRLQRAYWRVCGDFLFTGDITKPFTLTEDSKPLRFHAVSLWEVFEHLPEAALPGIFGNIDRHLEPEGVIVGSIATVSDTDQRTGVEYHPTVKSKDWWRDRFAEYGFEFIDDHGFIEDEFARGADNPHFKVGILRSEEYRISERPEEGFHFFARRKNSEI